MPKFCESPGFLPAASPSVCKRPKRHKALTQGALNTTAFRLKS